jgi:hypothetical protein
MVVGMTHPGYDVSDEEIATYWKSTGAPASLIDEVIKRDLDFKQRAREAALLYPRHPPIPHPCSCHECHGAGGMVKEKPDWWSG